MGGSWRYLLFSLGAVLALGGGIGYSWMVQQRTQILATPRLDFAAVDSEKRVFTLSAWQANFPVLLIYIPDQLSQSDKEFISQAAEQVRYAESKGLKTVFVSQRDVDYLFELKRRTEITAPFLTDPSGAVLRKMSEWSPGRKLDRWVIAQIDKTGIIARIEATRNPMAVFRAL